MKVDINDLIAAAENEFVADLDLKREKLTYTKDFYIALAKKLDEGSGAVEAYEALGFDTKKLGRDRAYAACNHAKELVREKGYTIDPSNYDGSIAREAMGNLSPEEELAYLKARNMYLESLIELQKKMPSILEEEYTFLKTGKRK